MKKNELNLLKGLPIKELAEKGKKLRKEIYDLVIDKNMKKLKDTKSVFKKRKDLAKVLTILRQKQLLNELESRVGSQESDGVKVSRVERVPQVPQGKKHRGTSKKGNK